jgi:hypothetical protein
MERLTQGFHGNYLDFYPSIFTTGAYPKGNLSWHHLWFILYLFLYDILCAPFFAWVISDRGKNFLSRLSWLASGKRIYLIVVPAVVLYCSMALHFSETNDLVHDGLYFPYWLLFLLGGFLCAACAPLMDSLERNRRISLTIAFCSIIALNYLRWNNVEPWDVLPHWKSDWRTMCYFALYPLNAWCWMLAAIGYGKKYLNKPHPALAYLNQAVYPFYILHQTIIIIVVYYLIGIHETVGMKYIFTVGISFFLTMGIFHLFIRPFALTRFLFGMKPKEKQAKSVAAKPAVAPDTWQPAAENRILQNV